MGPKLFSERMGYVEPRNALQIDGIDEGLRNRLLNWLESYIELTDADGLPSAFTSEMWDQFLKRPVSELRRMPASAVERTVHNLFHGGDWHRIYSLLEFATEYVAEGLREHFEAMCNEVLEAEHAGYRFVTGRIAPVTDKTELEALEEALLTPLPPARDHMAKALALFTQRESPNYQKAIHEAVSAVEAQLTELTGKSSVSEAVAELNKLGRGQHHKALLDAFKKLYGWTSDDGSGIRHPAKGEPAPSQALAKYTLVTCSAFVNYLEELRATR